MTQITHYPTELACALNGYRALMVPGLQGDNTSNWQNFWEQNIPRALRIRLHDWHNPDWVKWRNSIIASLISIDEPVVLIAEGFGALAAASVAAEYPGKIIALLLVNPADPDQFSIRKKIPKQSLPVPAQIVLSAQTLTDSDARTAALALLWGADFSHHPDTTPAPEDAITACWPEGIQALATLMGNLPSRQKSTPRAKAKKILAYLRAMNKPSLVRLNYLHN